MWLPDTNAWIALLNARRDGQSRHTHRPHDLQIAAIALVNDCALVTYNSAEFQRIRNLVPEDWEV